MRLLITFLLIFIDFYLSPLYITYNILNKYLKDTVGLDNVPGYSRVLALAHFLVTFKDKAAMTSAEVQKLKDLQLALSEYDRKRTVFPQRFSTAPLGRFCS